MTYIPKGQRKLITSRKAIAAEAARLRDEQLVAEAANLPPITREQLDLCVSYIALGDFHAPDVRFKLDAALADTPDPSASEPCPAEAFLRRVVDACRGFGVATTASGLLEIRAGRGNRGRWIEVVTWAYALHCESLGMPPCPPSLISTPSRGEQAAPELLARWTTELA